MAGKRTALALSLGANLASGVAHVLQQKRIGELQQSLTERERKVAALNATLGLSYMRAAELAEERDDAISRAERAERAQITAQRQLAERDEIIARQNVGSEIAAATIARLTTELDAERSRRTEPGDTPSTS